MAPEAAKRAALEVDGGANARTVVDGEPVDVEDEPMVGEPAGWPISGRPDHCRSTLCHD
jgi:hypothetical protein